MGKLVGKIDGITYNRNGGMGEGFYTVLFRGHEDNEIAGKQFVATVFDVEITDEEEKSGIRKLGGVYAVLSLASLVDGDTNDRWRGDRFEPELRKAIAAHNRRQYRKTNKQIGAALKKRGVL
jgi:hypothetical protein